MLFRSNSPYGRLSSGSVHLDGHGTPPRVSAASGGPAEPVQALPAAGDGPSSPPAEAGRPIRDGTPRAAQRPPIRPMDTLGGLPASPSGLAPSAQPGGDQMAPLSALFGHGVQNPRLAARSPALRAARAAAQLRQRPPSAGLDSGPSGPAEALRGRPGTLTFAPKIAGDVQPGTTSEHI